ncbi:MAG: sigma-70 family RNA polymerase sigma factor [Myxococcaceae bacterium]
MPTDDLTLVRRARSGDQRAFGLLVERYQKKVYAVALGMVKDAEEALDVSQEAFVKVHRYLDHFKGDSSFYTWLYRITTNTCIDVLRRRGASTSESVEYDDSVQMDLAEANLGALGSQLDSSPARTVLRRELGEKLEEALAQLPEKHRAILLLRELEGMSYEDLARTLEIPKGTVMSRLFHARAKVQRLLADYLADAPSTTPGKPKGGPGE